MVKVLSQDRAHQRLANAFLSGLWSRSSIFQCRLSSRSLTLLLGWVRPHLLVLQMRILLGFFALFPIEKKVRSAGQVVSAQLGGHVSSSTLSAHQMPPAGEPADNVEWERQEQDLLLEQTLQRDLMAAACGYRGRLDGEAGGRRRCLVLAQAYSCQNV